MFYRWNFEKQTLKNLGLEWCWFLDGVTALLGAQLFESEIKDPKIYGQVYCDTDTRSKGRVEGITGQTTMSTMCCIIDIVHPVQRMKYGNE